MVRAANFDIFAPTNRVSATPGSYDFFSLQSQQGGGSLFVNKHSVSNYLCIWRHKYNYGYGFCQ